MEKCSSLQIRFDKGTWQAKNKVVFMEQNDPDVTKAITIKHISGVDT